MFSFFGLGYCLFAVEEKKKSLKHIQVFSAKSSNFSQCSLGHEQRTKPEAAVAPQHTAIPLGSAATQAYSGPAEEKGESASKVGPLSPSLTSMVDRELLNIKSGWGLLITCMFQDLHPFPILFSLPYHSDMRAQKSISQTRKHSHLRTALTFLEIEHSDEQSVNRVVRITLFYLFFYFFAKWSKALVLLLDSLR